ncbi:sugar porter family MFS transporter [Desulfovibrio inopinatus]|uniref:sugar porter family MFS transporter n=1 Tax=Desulfovibrio inopinatus TaxID=102109 RepID=UPI000428C806|nr:sugar porter family MFS transporter [Desulfovibrio inopinatus]
MDERNKIHHATLIIIIIAAVAATGGLLFGFDTGVISGALLFIKKDFALSNLYQELVVSAVLVGCIIGAASSGKIVDRFGRRNVIIVTAIIFGLGSLWTGFAADAVHLVLGRIVVGLGIGVASFAVPLYLSEISPQEIRGALVSLNQLMITIGIVVSYLIDHYFATWDGGWRYMFLAGLFPALVLGIGMLFLPRTPRWLASKQYESEAQRVLGRIDPHHAEEEYRRIKRSLKVEKSGSFSDLFAPAVRPALLIGVGIMVVQQATGINTVIYYAPTIFEMAGFESARAAISATVGVGVVNVLMTIVAIRLVDMWGRKPLLYLGLSGMVLSLAVLGGAFALTDILGASLKWYALGSLFVYIASFAVSLGPIAWLMISEVYPLQIRGIGMSVATLANWLFNFIIALTFLSIIDVLGRPGAFWLYATIGIFGIWFTWKYIPETKGVPLEQIEKNLYAGKPARELGR